MPRKILDDKAKLKNGNELVINEDKEFYPLALEFWVKDLYKKRSSRKDHLLRYITVSSALQENIRIFLIMRMKRKYS